MTRVAYVNCAAGVAGDMLLGALVDAGADRERVAAEVAALGVDGYTLEFERTQRAGVAATRAIVTTDDRGHVHRPVREVLDRVHAKLPPSEQSPREQEEEISRIIKELRQDDAAECRP